MNTKIFFNAVLLMTLLAVTGFCCSGKEPLSSLSVVKATDMGVLETSKSIRGRDGGYSGVFEGRSVWIYGDTVLEVTDEYGLNWHHNSWSYTSDLDATDGISGFKERLDSKGAPTEFFPQSESEREFNTKHFANPCQEEPCGTRWALWPGAIVTDAERNRALIFYGVIYAETGDFNFEGVGSSIAVWEKFDDSPKRLTIDKGAEHPDLLFTKDEPAFGSAALILDKMLYAYGCELHDFAKPCILGRVELKNPQDRSAWRFWAGDGNWSKDLSEAKSVFDGNDIMTVSWNSFLNCYLAVYSQMMDTKVVFRTSPRPEGPWSGAIEAFTAKKPEEGDWVYDALMHPEFDRSDGRIIYVTYSRAIGFLQSERRLVEVEIERSPSDSE